MYFCLFFHGFLLHFFFLSCTIEEEHKERKKSKGREGHGVFV